LTLLAQGEQQLSGIQPIQFRIFALNNPAAQAQEKSSFVLP
jgi:hypothetical protein